MDTFFMIPDWLSQHLAAILVLLVIALSTWAALFIYVRQAKKKDIVSAKPLCLTEEQMQHVVIRRSRKPRRIIVRIPASVATDEIINEWADMIAPRLGAGFQPADVKIIPQKLWWPAQYEITFARLENLR